MLYSGKKIPVSRDKNNKYSNSRVVRNFFFLAKQPPPPPPPPPPPRPCKLNGRSLKVIPETRRCSK